MSHAAASEGLRELMEMLSIMDYIIIAVALVSMATGFYTGFLWQVVRIAGLVASVWVTWMYHPLVADSLGGEMSRQARLIIGAFIVFLASVLVCYLVAFLFRNLINALRPEMPDRLLGAGFGLLKAGLLVGVATFLAMQYLAPENPVRAQVENSRTAQAAATCVRAFVYVLPGPFVAYAEAEAKGQGGEPSLQQETPPEPPPALPQEETPEPSTSSDREAAARDGSVVIACYPLSR